MRECTVILFLFFFVLFTSISAFFLDLARYGNHRIDTAAENRLFVVSPGQTFAVITDNLRKTGLIHHPDKFKRLARLSGKDRNIKAGKYLFPPFMTPNTLIDMLVEGKIHLHRLTIPEGYHLGQIAEAVEAAGIAPAALFLRTATDGDFVRQTGLEAATCEGYLFPDTYSFPEGEAPAKIIFTMIRRFQSVFKKEWVLQAERLGFSIHQVVTLASIIEKETGDASERPIISSVFHNRLKKKMRLQSDPTVIYGIDHFDGNLTRKHLTTPTPYNTYDIQGLPPGPIANPGEKSLEAALFPQDTPYLYFVSKQDGTHYFSTNIAEHNQAVRKYQLNR